MSSAVRPRPAGVLDVADGIMLLVAVIWAANNVIVKAALDQIAPVPYVLGRFVLVVALLFPWLWLRGASPRVRRADWPLMAFSGLTGICLYNLLFTVGLAHTSAFAVALLISFSPIFTLLFAATLRLELIRPGQWFGIVVAAVGLGIFVADKLVGGLPVAGDLLSLVGAACFAAYSVASRPLAGRYGAPVVTAWSVLVGLILTLPIALRPALAQDWGHVGVGGWAALIYSAAFSMLVGYSLWSWAIARRGVGRTVVYLYLVPVLTGLFAVFFLGETLGPWQFAGAALVFLGVALVRGLLRLPASWRRVPTAPATLPPEPPPAANRLGRRPSAGR